MKLTKTQLKQMIREAASEYVWGVKSPGRVANKYKISVLKKLIKEELEGILTEETDSQKWSTITMGARIQFPEWEMLSGGGRMERLAKVLENPAIRIAFEDTYEKMKDINYKEGEPIAMSFFEKLRGAI